MDFGMFSVGFHTGVVALAACDHIAPDIEKTVVGRAGVSGISCVDFAIDRKENLSKLLLEARYA